MLFSNADVLSLLTTAEYCLEKWEEHAMGSHSGDEEKLETSMARRMLEITRERIDKDSPVMSRNDII